jgi:hypothetical protein
MAQMNRAISGVDTLFIPSDASNSFLASKLIREIARFGGDVTSMVPPPVAKRLRSGTEFPVADDGFDYTPEPAAPRLAGSDVEAPPPSLHDLLERLGPCRCRPR